MHFFGRKVDFICFPSLTYLFSAVLGLKPVVQADVLGNWIQILKLLKLKHIFSCSSLQLNILWLFFRFDWACCESRVTELLCYALQKSEVGNYLPIGVSFRITHRELLFQTDHERC
jgi:hypothetical protein